MKENGKILFETSDVVCIATGFKSNSANSKTGGMIQTWFLWKHSSPIDAIKSGDDAAICFDCPHRGDGTGKNRACYVNIGQAPLAVWRCWKRGGYSLWDGNTDIFKGKIVRFGSYGEPVLMPRQMMQRIAKAATGWTGYTHQWRRFTTRKQWLMASVDDETQAQRARGKGWRTFRVAMEQAPLSNEIQCPASEESGKRTTCAACQLCGGTSKNARSVAIMAHGTGKGNFSIN